MYVKLCLVKFAKHNNNSKIIMNWKKIWACLKRKKAELLFSILFEIWCFCRGVNAPSWMQREVFTNSTKKSKYRGSKNTWKSQTLSINFGRYLSKIYSLSNKEIKRWQRKKHKNTRTVTINDRNEWSAVILRKCKTD